MVETKPHGQLHGVPGFRAQVVLRKVPARASPEQHGGDE